MIKIVLILIIGIVGMGFVTYSYTSSHFTAQASVKGIVFSTADSFTTPTPTDTPLANPCDHINVSINGNGVGSYNGVVIICKNFKVVNQSNNMEVNTEINVESNTGNNSTSGNTGGDNNIETGDTSTVIIVDTEGSSNQNGPSPTFTPTPTP